MIEEDLNHNKINFSETFNAKILLIISSVKDC